MPQLSEPLSLSVKVTSPSFPKERMEKILSTPGIYLRGGHFEYPATEGNQTGNHLDAVFIIEPIAQNPTFVDWIVEDILCWIEKENIQFDVIFAPAQPAVKTIVGKLAKRTGARQAYWEYFPTGWFGSKLVSGEVKQGERALVFNGVTQQGRCVGDRLPSFVESLGAIPIAAAVFAKGSAPGVSIPEKRFGNKFYSAVQAAIQISSPDACTICQSTNPEISKKLTPWTAVRDSH
jgi:hypothetical protein